MLEASKIAGVSYQTVYNNVKLLQKMIYDKYMEGVKNENRNL